MLCKFYKSGKNIYKKIFFKIRIIQKGFYIKNEKKSRRNCKITLKKRGEPNGHSNL